METPTRPNGPQGDVRTPLSVPEALRAFSIAAQKRSLPAKYLLVGPEQPSHHIFLVLEGAITAAVEGACGREVMLAQFDPGAFFGEACLSTQPPPHGLLIRTRRVSLIAEMTGAEFAQFGLSHPEVTLELTRQLASRLHQISERLADVAFRNVSERITRTLDSLCAGSEVTLLADGSRRITVSRQELAHRAGCSREMAGRVIKQLEDARRLRTAGRALIFPGEGASGSH
jgi:CRP/FNR family transcriptional regulator, cyclic AMP receptor protein